MGSVLPVPALAIAGTQSGVGKTSVAIGLMRAFRQRGLAVQPFKVGPDFIDPGHHARAAGRPSCNLDGWMLDRETNAAIAREACAGADLAIVEGVMGLFDGYGAGEAGSTAQMAKWLGIPVVLVADVRGMARSAAAAIAGYANFDPDLTVAGVLCNRVGSPSHLDRIRAAAIAAGTVPVLGGLPRSAPVELPHRHLGLWRAEEDDLGDRAIAALAELLAAHLDLDALLAIARRGGISYTEREPGRDFGQASGREAGRELAQDSERDRAVSSPEVRVRVRDRDRETAPPIRIGVARDRAFCFYYAQNLEALVRAGAELVPFSPLGDRWPENLDGLYLGGGYPELYGAELARNGDCLAGVRALHRSGAPVYAECGGLMYLSRGIETRNGDRAALAGILPFWTRMGDRPKLGYAEVTGLAAGGWFPPGAIARGHRFHYSEIVSEIVDWESKTADLEIEGDADLATHSGDRAHLPIRRAYRLTGSQGKAEPAGWVAGQTLASYVHLHFASNPAIPRAFVARARHHRADRAGC